MIKSIVTLLFFIGIGFIAGIGSGICGCIILNYTDILAGCICGAIMGMILFGTFGYIIHYIYD